MQKENSILKYIDNEKDISNCNVSILESISNLSVSKKKSLHLEKSIVDFPFHKLDICDKKSVDNAFFLYRNNKLFFNKKYIYRSNFKNISLKDIDLFKRFFLLYNKIDFLEKSIIFFKETSIQQINPVQNKFIFDELFSYTRGIKREQLVSLENNALIEIEPLIVSKKRARAQMILMSIGLFLEREVSKLRDNNIYSKVKECLGDFNFYSDEINSSFFKNLLLLNEECDSVIDRIDLNIFKYYNYAVQNNNSSLKGTMGYNRYLPKLKGLGNIFEKHIEKNMSPSIIKISNIVSNSEFDYGIIFPVKRAGNERMFPFYYSIFSNGLDISTLMYSKFSNIKLYNDNKSCAYYKAIFLKNKEFIDSMVGTSKEFDLFYNNIISLSDHNTNSNNMFNLHNKHGNFIPIDRDKSCIYISRTRTDGEIMFSAMRCVNIILDDFRSDYFDVCSNIEFSIKNRIKNRKDKIFSYGS
tara:strand:+ start:980 stop:2386 length:1407 start_codon:yes stop_codon:yes gene_type:complete